jgi:DNA-binding MarR family transcriptional regulator
MMSHYMTALAMKQSGLKPAAKIVLYWLADHHNESTGACFPSLKTLAQECEMDVASIKRHLANLEASGLIQRTQRQRENGSQTSTQYTLHFAEPLAQNAPAPSAKCATPLAQNNTPLNLGIYNLGNEQDISCALDGFAEFWERYPRRIGKAAARKAYVKAMKVATPDDIMFGLSQQMPSLASREQQYIPHPSTWLTQERWNDEPDHNAPRNGTNARADRPGAGMAQAFAAVAERMSRHPQEGSDGGDGFI